MPVMPPLPTRSVKLTSDLLRVVARWPRIDEVLETADLVAALGPKPGWSVQATLFDLLEREIAEAPSALDRGQLWLIVNSWWEARGVYGCWGDLDGHTQVCVSYTLGTMGVWRSHADPLRRVEAALGFLAHRRGVLPDGAVEMGVA